MIVQNLFVCSGAARLWRLRDCSPPNNFVFSVIGIATKNWKYFYFYIQILLKILCDCLIRWANWMLCFRNAKETIFVSRFKYTFVPTGDWKSCSQARQLNPRISVTSTQSRHFSFFIASYSADWTAVPAGPKKTFFFNERNRIEHCYRENSATVLNVRKYRPDRDDSSSTPKFTIRTVHYWLRCTNHNH